MFAPKNPAPIAKIPEYYMNDPARLRLIACNTAIAIEHAIRSRHGT